MGGYGGGGYGAAVVDAFAEVDGLVLRVVVVSEMTGGAGDLDIIYAVVVKHFACYFRSTQAERFLRETLEFSLQ